MADRIDTDVCQQIGPPLSVTERYFKKYYYCERSDLNEDCEDHCILQHSNGVCVVCLSMRHSLLASEKHKIVSVDFQSGHVDRTSNKVSGKRKNKQGGQQLHPRSTVCVVSCEDGTKFNIRSCIRGILLEVNEQLIRKTDLILNKPLSDGYFAIIMPKVQDAEKVVADLLSEQEYEKRWTAVTAAV